MLRLKWLNEDLNLLDLNKNLSLMEIQKVLPNRSLVALSKKIIRLYGNLNKQKKYLINDNYFSIPNLENSYWAGFIAADGCIKGKKSTELSIALHRKDEVLLNQFQKDIGYTGPLHYSNYKNEPRYVTLNIVSENFTRFLKTNFNITSRKTFTLQPPENLTQEQSLAFIKGLIDGDGSIQSLKDGRVTISIVGNYKILHWIKNIFDALTPGDNRASILKHKSIFSYCIKKKSRINIIGNCLRQSIISHGLDRKWDKL